MWIEGVFLGLAAGFAPGPLLALVIAQTLRFGTREGARVAFAPLITDAPIVGLSLLLIGLVSESSNFLGVLTLAGAGFVGYLAIDSWRAASVLSIQPTVAARSIAKGVLVNFLSPHPYLFWFMVGAPTVIRLWQESAFSAFGFLAGFYTCLIGSKLVVAIAVGSSQSLVLEKCYGAIMRALGAILVLFAAHLLWIGLGMLGAFN